MFNPRTLISILFSLLMALLAVKAYSIYRHSPSQKQALAASSEKQQPETQAEVETPVPNTYSRLIPKGMRLVTIKVDEVSGVSRELAKNDRVDVIAVTDLGISEKGRVARAVLQDVTIFDVAESFFKKQLTDKALKKKKEWTIQLLVSLDQAIGLASLDESARLRLVLRNPDDSAREAASAVAYLPGTGFVRQGDLSVGLTSRITPGMRAISLEVEDSDGMCGRLRAGDRVDVISSFRLAKFSTQGGNQAVGTDGKVTGHKKSSKIILQNVMVISTDQPVDLLTGAQKSSAVVSLMVTPAQAEKIALLSDASKDTLLRLILRNPADTGHIHTAGALFSEQVLTEKRPFKVIDTIKGTKTYPRKYYED
jgi:Flp pilus assembly protein CpaB